MLSSERADQRFHAPETMPASESAHYRLCLLESKRISEGAGEAMLIREDGYRLSQVRGAA